jgi:Holliday junction resolvasome RuvABC DNA-binding subunit
VLAAITAKDLKGLTIAKGVGPKVAQSVLDNVNIAGLESEAIVVNPITESTRELAKTLAGLGWKIEQTEVAAQAAQAALPDGSESEQLRWAMARLRGDV